MPLCTPLTMKCFGRGKRDAARRLNWFKNGYHLNPVLTPFYSEFAENGYVETAYRLDPRTILPGCMRSTGPYRFETWEAIDENGVYESLNHYAMDGSRFLFDTAAGIKLKTERLSSLETGQSLKFLRQNPVTSVPLSWTYEGEDKLSDNRASQCGHS